MTSLLNQFLTLFNTKSHLDHNYFYDHVDVESIIKEYSLLSYLENKYNFLSDREICVEWEFVLFKEFMREFNFTKSDTLNEEDFYNYMEEFNKLDNHILRNKITISYICEIFQLCILGHCNEYEYNKYIPLCLFFGKKSINRTTRRLIYDDLDHDVIANTIIKHPLNQTTAIKLYCRFMIFSGKNIDNSLLELLSKYTFEEIYLAPSLDSRVYNINRMYNKRVRHFNRINIDNINHSVKQCNLIDKE